MNRGWIEEPGIARAMAANRRRVLIGSGAAALLWPRKPGSWLAAQAAAALETTERFMVIRHYQLAPGVAIADVVQKTETGFVPILREIEGFVEYYNIDLGNGEGLTISVFSSQAGAAESTALAAAWVQENLAASFAGAPEVLAGSVRLHISSPEAGSDPAA